MKTDMKKIVLAGGTGNLGSILTRYFLDRGFQVRVLTRQRRTSIEPNLIYTEWDGENTGDWASTLAGSDVLINMCGESINTRFTADNRRKLQNSRYLPTMALGKALQSLDNPPELWINFSGISIFEGADSLQDENSTYKGNSFLAELVEEWERLFLISELNGVRQVTLRLSPVLSHSVGMFAELYPLAKLGLGGKVGAGEQFVSWIHEQDLIRLVDFIIHNPNDYSLFHACSPNPVKNTDFMKALRKAARCSIGIPLPALFAKIGAYVKGVDSSLLLETNPVTTKNTLNAGFLFKYLYIDDAFKQLIKSV